MDKNVEKSCMEEISHSVCDEDRKVIITEISNNWNISFKESESVLMKWLDNYKGGKNVLKEYLIRGIDLNGNCVITVVPERKLDALERICPKYTSSLYSIELEGCSGRRLDIAQPTRTKFISLPLESSERKCNVANIPVSPAKPAKVEPSTSKPTASKTVNTMFAAAIKKETKETIGAAQEAKVKAENASPKKISPKKESPKKKDAKATKPSTAKSISSFFSAKPATSKPPAEPEEKSRNAEPIAVKTEIVVDTPPQPSKKRVLSLSDDESIPGTPQASNTPVNKKIKKEAVKSKIDKVAKNRSRIMQICDSSSDDDEPSTSKKSKNVEEEEVTAAATTDIKKEKENTTPTKNGTPEQMESGEAFEANGSEAKPKRRAKVKKMVTKTFEDEEGFINSIRVMEEVSCSEDEAEVIPSEKKPIVAAENGASTKGPTSKEKKKISPPAGKKQGSILSFFAKK